MHKYSNTLDNSTSFLCYKGQKWFISNLKTILKITKCYTDQEKFINIFWHKKLPSIIYKWFTIRYLL